MRRDGWVVWLVLIPVLLSGCAATGGGGSGTASKTEASQARPRTEPLTEKQAALERQAREAVSQKAYDVALAHLKQLHAERPDVASVIARMGWVRQQQSRRERAIALYRDAVTIDPGQRLALNNLALLERQRGRFEEARRWLEQGIRWHPGSARLHYNLAVLLELHLLELEQALSHYRRYQTLRSGEDATVSGWIADLERRIN
ncbi:hypothetical protein CF392_02415 [Tamilnaduibacter salinus]|uniref:Uncharacterized protein n=1 Tax=Tamilnaduibacter salinus TaxID=1484056 RepID=A0A2A2I4S5_9GAMM|nr:tetratricopeptide repeat protein [Tamilnaduibacter salinus]PAV27011.1 hypothetical protein CF392_02415 [Tamilnaduibacter salinus]